MRYMTKVTFLVFLLAVPTWLRASTITLRRNDASIRQLVSDIAKVAGANVLISNRVKGTVSVDFRNLNWLDATSAIAKASSLELKVIKDLKKTALLAPSWILRYSLHEKRERTFHLKFAKSETVSSILKRNLGIEHHKNNSYNDCGPKVTTNLMNNSITVSIHSWNRETISGVASLVRELDSDPSMKTVSERFTLVGRDVDLRVLLFELTASSGYRLDLSSNIGGFVSVNLRNMTFEKALRKVLKSNDLYMSKIPGHPGADVRIIPMREAGEKKSILGVHRYYLKVARSRTLLPPLRKKLKEWSQIPSLSAARNAVLSVDYFGNAITIEVLGQEVKGVLKKTHALIKRLDRP